MESPTTERPRTEVAAGLVFRAGKLLITQRANCSHLGGLWEFPGGKREPGESFEECLHRELQEEIGIEVEIESLFETVEHAYAERTVHLRFYLCRWTKHEPRAIECPDFAWVTAGDLYRYRFPAGDKRLLKRLRRHPEVWDQG